MSICLVRLLHTSPIQSASKALGHISHIQPHRYYNFKNVLCLCNPAQQCALNNYSNIRYNSTSSPPSSSLFPHLEFLQWRNYTNEINQVVGNIAESDTVLAVTEKMIQFHDLTGLQWWSVIVLSTIALRTFVILPFAVHQQYVAAKFEVVTLDMNTTIDKEVVQKVKKLAEENNWDQKKLTSEYENEVARRKTELIRKYNCHPLKLTILVFLQVPIWTATSCVLRNLTYMQPIQDITAQIVHAEMKANSFLWIHDLTMPDTYLPILLTIGTMLNVRLNVIARKGRRTFFDRWIILFYTGFTITLCTFAIDLPTSIVLYWTTSTWYAFFQNLILLSPKVRERLKLPITNTMRQKPYRKIMNRFKNFYRFLRY